MKFKPNAKNAGTPLQKAQREWAWNSVQIKGACAMLQKLCTSLGNPARFDALRDDLLQMNDYRFKKLGGTIKTNKEK